MLGILPSVKLSTDYGDLRIAETFSLRFKNATVKYEGACANLYATFSFCRYKRGVFSMSEGNLSQVGVTLFVMLVMCV